MIARPLPEGALLSRPSEGQVAAARVRAAGTDLPVTWVDAESRARPVYYRASEEAAWDRAGDTGWEAFSRPEMEAEGPRCWSDLPAGGLTMKRRVGQAPESVLAPKGDASADALARATRRVELAALLSDDTGRAVKGGGGQLEGRGPDPEQQVAPPRDAAGSARWQSYRDAAQGRPRETAELAKARVQARLHFALTHVDP